MESIVSEDDLAWQQLCQQMTCHETIDGTQTEDQSTASLEENFVWQQLCNQLALQEMAMAETQTMDTGIQTEDRDHRSQPIWQHGQIVGYMDHVDEEQPAVAVAHDHTYAAQMDERPIERPPKKRRCQWLPETELVDLKDPYTDPTLASTMAPEDDILTQATGNSLATEQPYIGLSPETMQILGQNMAAMFDGMSTDFSESESEMSEAEMDVC